MNIKKTESGWLLDDTVLFSLGKIEAPSDGIIGLSGVKGEDMTYGKNIASCIAFPGEYDVADISITCFEVENTLHYIIQFPEGERCALLQHAAVLEKKDIEGIDTWYVLDESIQQEIEQLELEGEVIILPTE